VHATADVTPERISPRNAESGLHDLRRPVQRWVAVAALLMCVTTGCRPVVHRAWSANATAMPSNAVLRVENHNAAAAKIFVVQNGAWKYLASIAGHSSDSLDLWSLGPSGAPLRMLATLAGGGTVHSDLLTVLPGQTVTFRIEGNLALSAASVR
jgi:hypothetical protein